MTWKTGAVWKLMRLKPIERAEVVKMLDELGQSSPSSNWQSWIQKNGYQVLVESNAGKHAFLVCDLQYGSRVRTEGPRE